MPCARSDRAGRHERDDAGQLVALHQNQLFVSLLHGMPQCPEGKTPDGVIRPPLVKLLPNKPVRNREMLIARPAWQPAVSLYAPCRYTQSEGMQAEVTAESFSRRTRVGFV
jgi:hypothetical protein